MACAALEGGADRASPQSVAWSSDSVGGGPAIT